MNMAKQMKHMPNLPALASAVCHIATIAVVMRMRTDLGTAPGVVGGSHRHLESAEPPHDPFDIDPLAQTVARLEKAVDTHGARLTAVEASVTELRKQSSDERRRAQTNGGQLHPSVDPSVIAEYARIIKRTVVSCDSDPHPHACSNGDKHRRTQSGEASCDADELSWRMGDINHECCDEASEDCSGGYPHSCNAGCAAVFLPFWAECHAALGKDSPNYEPVVEMCEAAAGPAPSLAQELNVACSDGTPTDECVPRCCEDLHGYMMLLNIEGHDSKLACELRHGLYSWVGPAVRPLATLGSRTFHFPVPNDMICHVLVLMWRDDCLIEPVAWPAATDGRWVPGRGRRSLRLGTGVRGAGGVRGDGATGRGHRDGPGRAAGPARQPQRRRLAAAATTLGWRRLHGATTRLSQPALRGDRGRHRQWWRLEPSADGRAG